MKNIIANMLGLIILFVVILFYPLIKLSDYLEK